MDPCGMPTNFLGSAFETQLHPFKHVKTVENITLH